jgi:hypothetical protein
VKTLKLNLYQKKVPKDRFSLKKIKSVKEQNKRGKENSKINREKNVKTFFSYFPETFYYCGNRKERKSG